MGWSYFPIGIVCPVISEEPDFASLRMVRERGQADLTLFRVRIDVPPAEGLLPGMTLEVRL